jgi:hypothetical protein
MRDLIDRLDEEERYLRRNGLTARADLMIECIAEITMLRERIQTVGARRDS